MLSAVQKLPVLIKGQNARPGARYVVADCRTAHVNGVPEGTSCGYEKTIVSGVCQEIGAVVGVR